MAEEKPTSNTVAEERSPEQKLADLVRACLLSVNEEISSTHLDRDFATMIGYHIPYKKFGFQSLDSYFESLSDVKFRRAANGTLFLSAGISKNTEHIFHLIAQQKPAKRRVHKLKKNNFRAVASFDNYDKWMEPDDSDNEYGVVCVKSSGPGAGGHAAPPKRENSHPNYRKPAGTQPHAEQRSNRAPNSVQKPPGSRYLGKNYDPNFHLRPKGQFAAPRFVPRGQSPAKSASDTSSDWGKDAEGESVPEAESKKKEVPNDILCEKNTEGMGEKKPIDLPVELSDLKISDIDEEAEPKVDEKLFGPKKVTGITLEFLSNKYNRDCADFLDKTTTKEEYAGGSKFCALQDFLKARNMPPAEFLAEILSPKHCEITVNFFVFCSYPDATKSLKESLEEMAEEVMQVFLTLDLAIEKDINEPVDFYNRILALVYAQRTGIWKCYIPKAYSIRFNEEIPGDWEKMIASNKVQDVAIDRLSSSSPDDAMGEIWKPKLVSVAWNRPPVHAFAAPTSYDVPPARAVQRTRSIQPPREFLPNVDLNSWTPRSLPPVHLEQLQLAPRKSYSIVVNHVGPGACLWVTVPGGEFKKTYDRMLSSLASAYGDHSNLKEVLVPTVGTCYVAFVRSAWHRVMVTEMLPNGFATVFLIDVGVEERIAFKGCLALDPQFAELPGQAVCCVLDAFEEFASHPMYLEFLHKVIVNGCFLAEVLSIENGKASVNLTGTGHLSGLQVNQHIAEKLGMSIPTHRILAVGQVLEVRMPHVAMSGSVYVRVEDDAQKLLHLMSHQLEHKLLWHPPQPVREVQIGTRIYFARLLDTENSVYRVNALAQPTSSLMVCVSFIDLGDKAFVPLNCLFELEGFFDPLWRLPPQAINVSLTSLPSETFTEAVAQRLQELVPADKPVLMKVVGGGFVPEVELFRRLLPENILVSVNNTLALDPTLRRGPVTPPSRAAVSPDASNVAMRAEPNSGLVSPSSPFLPAASMLQPPTIPPVGAQFDVHVPMVSNPNNFIVQPWNSYYNLQEMMFQLQQVYSSSGPDHAVPAAEISHGRAYAALHPDGNWYRVSASSQVINEDSVLASFADYGDLQVLQLVNMRHLAPRFFQLPCQAIRAHLYGVKPLHQDWCVQDCLAFQALVNEQQFVSIVMSKPEDVDPQKASVGLKLIDTSGSEDVHIDQRLVNEGRAELIGNGM